MNDDYAPTTGTAKGKCPLCLTPIVSGGKWLCHAHPGDLFTVDCPKCGTTLVGTKGEDEEYTWNGRSE